MSLIFYIFIPPIFSIFFMWILCFTSCVASSTMTVFNNFSRERDTKQKMSEKKFSVNAC